MATSREERTAPVGKFRVIGVDTFDGDDWIEGDFESLDKARAHVKERTKGKQMLKMHIYNDQGKHAGKAGVF